MKEFIKICIITQLYIIAFMCFIGICVGITWLCSIYLGEMFGPLGLIWLLISAIVGFIVYIDRNDL